jgi:hypothetical protein
MLRQIWIVLCNTNRNKNMKSEPSVNQQSSQKSDVIHHLAALLCNCTKSVKPVAAKQQKSPLHEAAGR